MWPFFDTFEKFLKYLHKMALSSNHKVPIERFSVLSEIEILSNYQLFLDIFGICLNAFPFRVPEDHEY